MQRFEAYQVALELIAALGPVIDQIQRRDPDLARQLRKAGSSVALNLAEGSRRSGRDRIHLYRVAAGSAGEVRAALAVAGAWRYADPARIDRADQLSDRELAMLWRLTHPRP